MTREYLSYLARHPATARRIARKLAVKFVRDDPSEALVAHLASVYREHNTEIKPVLRALVDSEEFALAVGAKVRDPGEDVVATYRALGVKVRKPTGRQAAANVMAWQASDLGALPFGWPRPDGPPIDNDSWAYPSRLMASMNIHATISRRVVADAGRPLPQATVVGAVVPHAVRQARRPPGPGAAPPAIGRHPARGLLPRASPARPASGSPATTPSSSGTPPDC